MLSVGVASSPMSWGAWLNTGTVCHVSWKGQCGQVCYGYMGPILTAFAASVEEKHQGNEEEDEQDACADSGPGDDAHR